MTTPRLSILWLLTLTTVLFCALPARATDLSFMTNAGVTGNYASLLAELSELSSPACTRARCEISFAPIPFTLRTPGYSGGAQVTLSHAKVLNNIVRSSSINDSGHSRPILLRGMARVRHLNASSGGAVRIPITAVLYRHASTPELELALPYRRGSQTSTSGLAMVRAKIIGSNSGYVRNAFFSRTPAAVVRNKTCQATRSAPLTATSHVSFNTWATNAFRALASYKVVYVATDFDPLFSESQGCSSDSECNDKILAIVHHAALFYEAQLGMTLEVARQYGQTLSYTTSTDSGVLLDDFAQQNATNRASVLHDGINSGPDLIDAFVLYTGRDIDQNVIGLAYLGLGCINSDAAGAALMVQDVSRTFNPVVTAHELGHVFNADHSSQGIMQASLAPPLPSKFSSFSVNQITTHKAQYYGQCRQGTSSGIGDELDQPLTLQVQKLSGGKIKITYSTTTLHPGCSLFIRAGQTAAETNSGTVIKKFTPQSLSSSISGTVTQRIKSASSANSRVFLRAFYKCTDSYMFARSPVISFNANYRAARKGTAVTRKSWIAALDRAFP